MTTIKTHRTLVQTDLDNGDGILLGDVDYSPVTLSLGFSRGF